MMSLTVWSHGCNLIQFLFNNTAKKQEQLGTVQGHVKQTQENKNIYLTHY
jgi:hypothetical protein